MYRKKTALKILYTVLKMFHYRVQGVQMWQPGNSLTDNAFKLSNGLYNYFTVKYNEDKTSSLQILLLNEAHFSLTRNLISKNTAHLEDENSHGVRHRVYMKLKKQCGATSHSLTFWVRTFYLGSLFHRYKNVVYHKCSANKKVSELCNS